MTTDIPTLRWGIIATGLICSWFVDDLVLERRDARAKHVIQAIGSSTAEKGREFAKKHLPGKNPTVYGNYHDCYHDPDVDIIYIGTPHAFHRQNCLDAIAAGKHILCEKAFTITAKEAREVFESARERGVFIMEAMWTRHFPLTKTLRHLLHEERLIGEIRRVFCDFAKPRDLSALGPESRMKNPALGAGSLLDVGVYCLTWALLGLDAGIGEAAQRPKITAVQTLSEGIDVATSALLLYRDGKQGILTSSMEVQGPLEFCRIEGTNGHIVVHGIAASVPSFFTVYTTNASGPGWAETSTPGQWTKKFDFERPGKGFYWEADAVALDIFAGRKENDVMPWSETVRVLEMLDEIRRQGGARFPQDDE